MVFHELNRLTGRIAVSAKLQPLFPIRPVALNKADPPKIMWDHVATKPASTNIQQQERKSTLDPRLIALQKKFQADLSKPVYLMGGTSDKVLYYATWGIAIVCGYLSIEFIASQINEK